MTVKLLTFGGPQARLSLFMSKCHIFGKLVSWLNFCTFAECSSTHLSRIFPLLSFGPVHFRFKGCWVVFIIFIQILIEHSVDTLTRHRVLLRLIWVCTVCQWVKCYQFLCSLQIWYFNAVKISSVKTKKIWVSALHSYD